VIVNYVNLQLSLLWDVEKRPKDLPKMELAVLSTLGWKVQTVTAAAMLDTLVCLLEFQGNKEFDSIEQTYVVRENCKLVLAKALRGDF
jgi:hypothetical protein